jgi:hypothetical protein
MIVILSPLSGAVSRVTTEQRPRRKLVPSTGFRIDFQPRLMLGAPFRARATHVVQLGTVGIAYVHHQVVNDARKVGDCPSRFASKARHCGPARRSRCDRRGADDAFPDHLFSLSGWSGHRRDLADLSCRCARAIAVPVERLLLKPARRFPGLARPRSSQLTSRPSIRGALPSGRGGRRRSIRSAHNLELKIWALATVVEGKNRRSLVAA